MSSGAISFAFFAGSIATVNPCGFALLPAYLGRRLGSHDAHPDHDPIIRAVLVGAVTTAGLLLVFATLGAAISLGARTLIHVLPWASLLIGIALAVAGAALLAGRHIAPRLPHLRTPTDAPVLVADLAFGIGYGIASLSCALPIFLAATGTAVTGSLAASLLNRVRKDRLQFVAPSAQHMRSSAVELAWTITRPIEDSPKTGKTPD
jgi:cytochrome c biogenesis protein CcdA